VLVLVLVSSVVSTQGRIAEEQAKIVLLLQFIVPMGGMVLGQIYEAGEEKKFIFERMFLYVLSILVPAQLLLTWLQGNILLSPYLYMFSIYQHLQYVPVIFVGGYLVAFYSLWEIPNHRRILIILAPLMGIYVAASGSMVAMVALGGGVGGYAVYTWRQGYYKWVMASLVLVLLSSGNYLGIAKNTDAGLQKFGFLRMDLAQDQIYEINKLFPNIATRLRYWDSYSKKIVNNSTEFLLGHAKRPDRAKSPSAHNYYLDFIFNFGVLAILPLLALIGYTVLMVYLGWKPILASSSLLGLTLVVFLLVFVDNSFKVGLRQPYPGILTFFLWGVLLSRLSESSVMARHNVTA